VSEALTVLVDSERFAERGDFGGVARVKQDFHAEWFVAHYPTREDAEPIHLGKHAVKLSL
jgi:hypothetical protein